MNYISASRFVLLFAFVIAVGNGCSPEAKKERHLKRANKAFEAGDYEAAELEYFNALRLEKTNQMAIRNLGLMAADQGRLGHAYSLLTQAKKNDPNDFRARLKLAQCLLTGGAFMQAHEEALFLFEKQPTNSEVPIILVESSATTNELEEAERLLTNLKGKPGGGTAGYDVACGMIQLRKRNFKSAEEYLRKALSIDPKSSAAYIAMGYLHLLRHEKPETEAAYKKAAELAPTRSPYYLAYVDYKLKAKEIAEVKKLLEPIAKQMPDYLPAQMRLAKVALMEQRFVDCENILRDILTRDPIHLEAMLFLARLRIEQNEPARAVSVLELASREYPDIAQIYYQLAQAQLKNNDDVGGAISSLNQALNNQSDFPEAVMLLAESNIRRNDTASAIHSLTNLLSQHPDLSTAHLLLATAYQVRGNEKEALNAYHNLSRLHPSNPHIPLRIGMYLRQEGRNDEARKNYETALTLEPHFLPAIEQLVGLDLVEKRFADAEKRIQKELESNSTNAALYLLLGKTYLALTNQVSAENALLKAIKINPEFGEAHSLLGQIYVSSNRHKEALRKLEEGVAQKPDDIASWLQIAQLQSASSNYSGAKVAYEKVLALNSQFPPALNNLAWLCLEHLNDLKRASELANTARRIRPNDPTIADTLGWVFYRAGDFPKALALLKESVEKLPNESEILFHLGMTHYKMGDEPSAKRAFQTALRLTGTGKWREDAEKHLRVIEMDPATADKKTVADLEDLLTKDPDDSILSARLATIFEREGNWKKAALGYEKSLTLNSNLVPVIVKLANIYSTHLNDSPRALILARRARKLEPVDPAIGHMLGKIAFDSATTEADFQWAFSLLQESAQKLSTNPQVLFDDGWAVYSLGKVSNAVEIIQRALSLKPSATLSQKAENFVRMNALLNNPAEAQTKSAEIQQLLKTEPNYVPGLMVEGLLQEQKKDYKAAAETYERILKRYPLFSPADRRLAILYYDPIQNMAQAYEHANKAREAFPQDAQIGRVLGMLEYDHEKFPRAIQLLTESAKSFPSDGEIFYKIGIAHFKLRQKRESKHALTNALALAPTSPLAAEAKRFLYQIR